MIKNAKTFTFGVVTDSSSYILMLDSAQFKHFGDRWFNDPTFYKLFESAFYDGYKINPNNSVAANELAFLKALTNLNCGIKLFRGNASLTQFTPIRLNTAANAVEVAVNCIFLPS
jgi:hypothetical protein